MTQLLPKSLLGVWLGRLRGRLWGGTLSSLERSWRLLLLQIKILEDPKAMDLYVSHYIFCGFWYFSLFACIFFSELFLVSDIINFWSFLRSHLRIQRQPWGLVRIHLLLLMEEEQTAILLLLVHRKLVHQLLNMVSVSHTKSSLSFFICVLSFFYHQNDIFVSISTFMNHVSDPLDHILKTHFHSCCVCLVVNWSVDLKLLGLDWKEQDDVLFLSFIHFFWQCRFRKV